MKISYSILILGSEGQLGREFRKLSSSYTSYAFSYVSRKELDMNNQQSQVKIKQLLNQIKREKSSTKRQDLIVQMNEIMATQINDLQKIVAEQL